MNNRGRSSLQTRKAPAKQEKEKAEMQRNRPVNSEKRISRRGLIREKKITLQQDVDKLKKKLRHEENVHRALERAFTRPLGALPRLPSYLPPNTRELLAEVAVLEEEVVRLEEKVVQFRQGLYQEAVYNSSSKKSVDSYADSCAPAKIQDLKPKQSKSLLQFESNSAATEGENFPSLSDVRRGKENQSGTNPSKNKQQSPNSKVQTIKTSLKRPPIECGSADSLVDAPKLQSESHAKMERKTAEERNPCSRDEMSPVADSPNKISESILKCLMSIFLRMSSVKSRSTTETLPSLPVLNSSEEFQDPYGICSQFGKRDIGPYRSLFSIEAPSINPNQAKVSVFQVQRLKLLLEKLASVNINGLTHQEKLAFWINIYNSCMMNAFIEYGIPESPEIVVALMQKATVNVAGHILNAITIEHFILRLPFHSKYTFSKSSKYYDKTIRSMFGLELSEPLVTFALSCGSWSSPAVRVYTASQVESELETAKREYLQATIGISTAKNVIAIPKLLDWYLLDFAKDIESLLDWICLQLPSDLRKQAMEYLERRKDEPLVRSLQIIPYEFSFRYLVHR